MNDEEILNLCKNHSDHRERVQEFLPALLEGLKQEGNIMETGNGAGGSGLFILYHMKEDGRERIFITNDAKPCPQLITEYATKWNIPHTHYQMPIEQFVNELPPLHFTFIYHDSDHYYSRVSGQLEKLAEKLVKGGIMAVDDVNEWPSIPTIQNLEPVKYETDEGKKLGTHGHHIAFYRKM